MAWPDELRPYERRSSVAEVGGFRPPDDPVTSWIGTVLVGAPGETWPETDGRPLHPICQIRLDDLPAPPPAPLHRFAFLSLFLDLAQPPSHSPNGHGWVLRTYESLEGLRVLEPPAVPPEVAYAPTAFPLRWRQRVEVPSRDEAPDDLLGIYDDHEAEDWPRIGTKVGGWAETIQSEVMWSTAAGRVSDADLVLQIDTDEKARPTIGDAGVAHIGWSPSAGWLFDWQCF